MSFIISEITIAHEISPLGMDIKSPQIAWKFKSDESGMKQQTARICVNACKSGEQMWDSGILETSRSIGIKYGGKPLAPCTEYKVTVFVTAENGEGASAESTFETGFLGSENAWGNAQWIGADEYYVCSDAMGIFAMESTLSISEGGTAGLVFGANDARLLNPELNEKMLCGENYIRYEISLEEKMLYIFRVGYDENDRADKPFAAVPVSGIAADSPFLFRIEVTGNNAAAYINGETADSPRQLNPLGGNDVPTFPRLCDIGYYSSRGTKVHFSGIKLSFLRKPANTFSEIDSDGIELYSESEDIQIVKSPDCHALPMLRRDFTAAAPIAKARLYVTARGIYDCRINGEAITDSWFNPGASQFDKHLMYQTYDITHLVRQGDNGIGFTLSSGWWSGSQTFTLMNYNYWGDKESVLAKIVLTYADGTDDVFTTNDTDWQYYGEGPYKFAGFFQGERFDGNKMWIYENFSKPHFTIEGIKKPIIIKPVPIPEFDSLPGFFLPWGEVNFTEPEITGSFNAPVRAVKKFTAVSVSSPADGIFIYDMGQEIAGVPILRLKGKKGTEVRIRYGEMLYPEMYGRLCGRLLQENLRDASSTDIYILSGSGTEIYCPKFTFHGYRYIEISGLSDAPELSDVRSIQLSSVESITGEIKTDNELVNRFTENVKYSQLCNFISIPTDCPQRNERMGWTGDGHVFARTASYQSNAHTFYLRYLQAIRDVQLPDGNIPNIAPIGGGFGGITYAVCIHLIVWEIYQHYGDIDVIEENYDAMKRCTEYYKRLGMPGTPYVGPIDDWLAPAKTDSNLVWNAFYGRAMQLMERFAGILGKADDEQYYNVESKKAKQYWNDTFVDEESGKTLNIDGTLNDTQGGYSIGLGFEMFAEEYRQKAFGHLARTSRESGYTVTTGFFGTSPINPMLSEGGYAEDAYKMMTSTAFPSWLFPVTQGATTIWEHWDSYTAENGFGEYNSMNSFNHYSLGAVVSWLYEYVLGIQRDISSAGYGHFILKPDLVGFKAAHGGFETPYGRIEAAYEIDGRNCIYRCTVPENTTAELILPNIRKTLGSGKYKFELGI